MKKIAAVLVLVIVGVLSSSTQAQAQSFNLTETIRLEISDSVRLGFQNMESPDVWNYLSFSNIKEMNKWVNTIVSNVDNTTMTNGYSVFETSDFYVYSFKQEGETKHMIVFNNKESNSCVLGNTDELISSLNKGVINYALK